MFLRSRWRYGLSVGAVRLTLGGAAPVGGGQRGRPARKTQGVTVTKPGKNEPTAEDDAAAGQAARSLDDDAVAGERYGVAQARALLRSFREDTGRDAQTIGELAEWVSRRNR